MWNKPARSIPLIPVYQPLFPRYCPAWVPVLTSFNGELQCQSINQISPFFSKLCCAKSENPETTKRPDPMQEQSTFVCVWGVGGMFLGTRVSCWNRKSESSTRTGHLLNVKHGGGRGQGSLQVAQYWCTPGLLGWDSLS